LAENLIYALIYCNILLLAVVVLLFGSIIIIRSSKKSKFDNKDFFLKKVTKSLNRYLIATTEQDELEEVEFDDFQLKKIKKSLYTNNRKDYTTTHLLSLKKELFGEMDEALDHAYTYLSLHEHSLKKTKSIDHSIRVQGFQELSIFKSKLGLSPILKHVNSRNLMLRQEAQVALVKLSTREPLSFFRKLVFDITDWEKLLLYSELTATEFKHATNFEQYLNSPFDGVNSFIIRLCTLFKKIETMRTIRHLLKTETSTMVIVAGLIAIREMGDERDITLTKDLMLKHDNDRIKIEGLKTLGSVEDPNNLDFITSYLEDPNLQVQFCAMYALNEITFEVGHYLQAKEAVLSEAHDLMISHIQNPLN